MRRWRQSVIVLAVGAALTFCGQPVEGLYGSEITVQETTRISEITNHPEKYLGKTVRVEGELFDVCQEMGCWFSIKDKTGAIYVDLYMGVEYTIPKQAGGHYGIVQGMVTNEKGKSALKLKGKATRIIKSE